MWVFVFFLFSSFTPLVSFSGLLFGGYSLRPFSNVPNVWSEFVSLPCNSFISNLLVQRFKPFLCVIISSHNHKEMFLSSRLTVLRVSLFCTWSLVVILTLSLGSIQLIGFTCCVPAGWGLRDRSLSHLPVSPQLLPVDSPSLRKMITKNPEADILQIQLLQWLGLLHTIFKIHHTSKDDQRRPVVWPEIHGILFLMFEI